MRQQSINQIYVEPTPSVFTTLQPTQRQINELTYWVGLRGKMSAYEASMVFESAVISAAIRSGLIVEVDNYLTLPVVEVEAASPEVVAPEAPAVEQVDELKLRDDRLVIFEGAPVRRQVWTGSEQKVKREARILSIGCDKINRTVRVRHHGNNCWLLILSDGNCSFCNRKKIDSTYNHFCSEGCQKEKESLSW